MGIGIVESEKPGLYLKEVVGIGERTVIEFDLFGKGKAWTNRVESRNGDNSREIIIVILIFISI